MSKYDLAERTRKFSEEVITFCNRVPKGPVNFPLISQLVRSGTSIGANYCEADDAPSRKEFIHRIGICKKEARETMYWLDLMKTSYPKLAQEIESLRQEAREFNLIFNSIHKKTVANSLVIRH